MKEKSRLKSANLEEFTVESKIGKGKFSIVLLVSLKNNEFFTIKVVPKKLAKERNVLHLIEVDFTL